jgi:hypothetical protein
MDPHEEVHEIVLTRKVRNMRFAYEKGEILKATINDDGTATIVSSSPCIIAEDAYELSIPDDEFNKLLGLRDEQ